MTMLFSCAIKQDTTSWNQHGLVPLSPAYQLCGLRLLGLPPCFCLCHISCFKAPFLGSLLLGPPVSPLLPAIPAHSLDSGVPAHYVVPWGHCITNPCSPPPFFFPLLSIPSHSAFSPPPSPVHASVSPSREDSFLGKRVGERRGLGQNKGEDFLDVVQTEKDRWKK